MPLGPEVNTRRGARWRAKTDAAAKPVPVRTGAPPPNKELWDKIAKDDVFMQQLKKFNLGVTNKVRSAYYFEKWPGVHKAFSDAAIKAVTGSREDIPKALAAGAPLVSNAAK